MEPSPDVIVVGAGLAGLVAALRLQQAGHRVLVLERRERPGGLCGTEVIDGHEFVIACNDFGLGMEREMQRLGVPISFLATRTRFQLPGGSLELPVGLSSLAPLLRRAPGLARFAWGMRAAREASLGALVERTVRNPVTADWLNSLAYPLGMPPQQVRLETLRAELSREYAYGYQQPRSPAGGPARLVAAMLRRLEALGGALKLGVEVREIRREGARKILLTDAGEYVADGVVSSEGRWDQYPAELPPALAVSSFLLAVDRGLPFPEGVHTLVHQPAGVRDWMSALDAGEFPPRFGFHLFRSDLPGSAEHFTLNVFLYLPRSEEDPSEERVARVRDYVFGEVETLLPGIGRAVEYCRFLSPGEFRRRYGLSSRVTERVMAPGFRKPDSHDPERDVYFVGNSVHPPGEHAGGAILSAALAADALHRAASRRGRRG